MCDDDFAEVHLYPQPFEHCEAYICGTHAGLKRLRDQLTVALESNASSMLYGMPSDGESHDILIALVDPATFERTHPHYSYERGGKKMFGPWDLDIDWEAKRPQRQ